MKLPLGEHVILLTNAKVARTFWDGENSLIAYFATVSRDHSLPIHDSIIWNVNRSGAAGQLAAGRCKEFLVALRLGMFGDDETDLEPFAREVFAEFASAKYPFPLLGARVGVTVTEKYREGLGTRRSCKWRAITQTQQDIARGRIALDPQTLEAEASKAEWAALDDTKPEAERHAWMRLFVELTTEIAERGPYRGVEPMRYTRV